MFDGSHSPHGSRLRFELPACRRLTLDGLVCSTPPNPPPRRPKPPRRRRGKVKRVHALSSFQRTKAPAASTVRRPRRDHRFPAAPPIKDRLSNLRCACLPCQPFFRLPFCAVSFVAVAWQRRRMGRVRPADAPIHFSGRCSGGFQAASRAARALDRGHRVKRVSPIYEADVGRVNPAATLFPTGRADSSRESGATSSVWQRRLAAIRLRSAPAGARAGPSGRRPAAADRVVASADGARR